MAPKAYEKKLILDTSVLLRWWHKSKGKFPGQVNEERVKTWARNLIQEHDTRAIVTPVYIELVAGALSKFQLQLSRAFLEEFDRVDRGEIPIEDWQDAIRLAQWSRRNNRPRDLGDCLIRAIAKQNKKD